MVRQLRFASLMLLVLGCAGTEEPPSGPRLRQLTDLGGDETRPHFAPDGRRVAFASEAGGHRDILVLDLESAEITPIVATAADESEPRWDPSGGRLAYESKSPDGRRGIWIVDREGGGHSRVSPEALDAFRPRWSPSGGVLAFTVRGEAGDQVWLSDDDVTSQLTKEPATHIAYDWSPDGRYVLVISFSPGAQDLWAWPVDGSPPRRLTEHADEEWWPAWSPAGDRVAFYSTWDDAMTEIWTVSVESGELIRVTDLPVEDFRPVWSPDGKWLTFSSDRESKSGLWRQPLDGEAVPIALHGRAGGLPHWAPDGRSIVFSFVTSKEQLFRVSRDGGEPLALTPGERDAVEAAVSSDGSLIAYEANDVGTEADLFVLDVASGTIQRLTDETDYNARPSWSPDGSKLTFERSAGGGMRTSNVGILSTAGGTPESISTTGYVRSPVWCGSEVVFTVEHSWTNSGPDQLWVVAAGGEARQLTFSPGDKRSTDCTPDGLVAYHERSGSGPQLRSARLLEDGALSGPVDLGPGEGGRWSADGTEIVFLSDRDGQPDLYIVSIDDGSVFRLTETAATEGWPDFLHGTRDVIYSVNLGGRDIWIARVE